jgi:ribosomal protein RSM22 (predicted rRNA methylase)
VTALPPSLREAVARYCVDVDARSRSSRAAKLSVGYRAGAPSAGLIADDADIAAYLAARLPATYAAVQAALHQVKKRAPDFAPRTILDVGAGPGTASWAAVEIWPGIESITMLDHSRHFLAAARTLADASEHAALRNAEIIAGDIAVPIPSRQYDLVIASYAFAELGESKVDESVSRLWDACCGALVLVEPGTPQGFSRILRCRNVLRARKAAIAAPCPGDYPCPIVAPDWCHFSVRLPRSRDHMRAKQASVPYEDERFSYVAASRESVVLSPPSARIIAQPQDGKPGMRFKLCTDGRIDDRSVPRRDKSGYKAVTRKKWGDTL